MSGSDEPKIPVGIIVGRMRFRTGVKVSTVQGTIERLARRYERYNAVLWKIRKHKGDLPREIRILVENALDF